jgi:hypothetical protein
MGLRDLVTGVLSGTHKFETADEGEPQELSKEAEADLLNDTEIFESDDGFEDDFIDTDDEIDGD